jgi:hypothetical protein
MQIETWNILLNALIAVLLVGYGIWLRSIFRHQLASKDSTIENLGAAIKANEAEIARLRGETSPAIAEAYERLKKLTDAVAAESNDLSARLKAADAERPKLDEDFSLRLQVSHVRGFQEATEIFTRKIIELSKIPHPSGVSSQDLFSLLTEISQGFTARKEVFTQWLRDAQAKAQ